MPQRVGRLPEGKPLPDGRATEFRLSSDEGALKILRDDIYKLRRLRAEQIKFIPGIDISTAVEASTVFNPRGAPKFDLNPDYFIGVQLFPFGNAHQGGANGAPGGDDFTFVTQFYLPFDVTITAVVFEVTSNVANRFVGVGLFDIEKQLVFQTGAVSASAVGVKRVTLSPVEVSAGIYWQAWTAGGGAGTPALRALQGINNIVYTTVFDSGTQREGNITGGSVGVLPASFTSVSASVSGQQAYVLFECV